MKSTTRCATRYARPRAAIRNRARRCWTSQSAKSAWGGEQLGYDAGKKARGRKRQLLVDTWGLLLVCVMHSASLQDRAGVRLVLYSIDRQYPTIELI
jgi:hypothetical protein